EEGSVMRYRFVLKTLAAGALLAGSLCLAQAQTTTTPGVVPPGVVPGSPVGTPFLSPANSIVPDVNTMSSAGTFNGFSPFFGNPFATNPFFNPFFTGVGAPLVYSLPYPGPLNPANFAAAPPPARGGPTLGVNTLPHTAGGGPVPYVRTRAAIVAPMPLNSGGGAPASTATIAAAA